MTAIADDNIKIARRIASTRLNRLGSGLDEATYINNLVETVYADIKRLNPLDSLRIAGFEDVGHIRRFEMIFLERINEDRLISTGRYLRQADETKLTYTIRMDF
ncbi:MAG: hypothetical protein Q7S56_00760 [Nanoarchaeota archaeon]|nr:hypothetical protein [Nanoarchaeota archaeon]